MQTPIKLINVIHRVGMCHLACLRGRLHVNDESRRLDSYVKVVKTEWLCPVVKEVVSSKNIDCSKYPSMPYYLLDFQSRPHFPQAKLF